MRKAFALLLFVCIATFQSRAQFQDVQFFKAFFKNKNAVLTMNNCWTDEKNKRFVEKMAKAPNLQQVGYFNTNNVSLVKTWSSHIYFVLDVRDCNHSLQILFQLNKTKTFNYIVKYLLLVELSELTVFRDILNGYQILPNCELVVAVFGEQSALLYQPYKVEKINNLTWENYGNWSLEAGLFEYYWDRPTSRRRINLKRANLVVCLVIYEKETLQNMHYLTEYNLPGDDTFAKQDYEPMLCTLKYMNVNYSFTIVGSYGYEKGTSGVFSGLINELQTGKADVSGASLYFTEDRFKVVDMIKQGNNHAVRFVMRKPSTSYMKNIFFITLTSRVWLASLIILAVFALVIIVILNWEAKHKKRVKQNKYSLSDVTLISLEAVCQQGTATEPQSFSGRVLVLILFGAFMFIYVSYSANIVVLLQSTTKITDVRKLLESRIEVGGFRNDYMKNYFEKVRKGPLRQLYLQKIYPDRYFSLDVGMKKVLDGNFAFHVVLQSAYQYMLKYFTNHEICSMQELPGYIEHSLGYIGLPKHSPYKDLFKVALLRVDEYGLQRRTNTRIIQVPRCFSTAGTFKSVGFYDCEQVLWIWIGGTLLAVLIFVIEKVVYYFSTRVH